MRKIVYGAIIAAMLLLVGPLVYNGSGNAVEKNMELLTSAEAATYSDVAPIDLGVYTMYVKFDGVDGEAQDSDHNKWCNAAGYSHEMNMPTRTGYTRRRRSASHEPFKVVKELDKATPKLAYKLNTGEVIPKVEFEVVNSMGLTYMRYELKNVRITGYSVSGATEGGNVPTEEISLNYEEIKWTYTEFDDTGSSKGKVETEWKVEN